MNKEAEKQEIPEDLPKTETENETETEPEPEEAKDEINEDESPISPYGSVL